ncbi:site-specific integrase [Caminicella sporogenes]|uniref:site-specific integrase n=1 Tax=Caminicella sporogenes TaxID=166485 RepID=UPI002540FC80|nr:site-specific integrase [Caminicella sporogenes]WIF95134.1 site-specific integrase [Caminicella sporogenes]
MNFVEPIRDPTKVHDICNYLKRENPRNYILFLLGVYTGLRISDILKLKVKDVKNKSYITIREKKTKKQRIIQINPVLKRELKTFCKDKDLNEYLIKSREGCNSPISRSMAYKILREVAEMFGLSNIGTHTLRKTFGYHFYKQTKDVVTLQRIFNHSHPSITLKYIGIEQETINKAIKDFRI